MDSYDKIYEEFDRKMWRTVGARFNAARRLRSQQNWSVVTISMLSLYIVAISIPGVWSKVPESDTHFFPAISILASIFVIILSLLEASRGYEVKADRLHRSAMKLNEIYSELLIGQQKKDANPSEIISRYHAEIQTCPENHDAGDDALFRAQQQKHFKMGRIEVLLIKTGYFFNKTAIYLILLVIPPIILILKLSY